MITPKTHYSCLIDLKRGIPVLFDGVPFESEETDLSSFISGFMGTLEHFVQDYIPTGLLLKHKNSNFACGIGRKDSLALWTMGPAKENTDPYILHYKLSLLLDKLMVEDIKLASVVNISNKEKNKFFKETKLIFAKKHLYANRTELVRIVGFIPDIIAYNICNCYIVPCRSPIDFVTNTFSNSDEKQRTIRVLRYAEPLSIMLNMWHAFASTIFPRIDFTPELIQLRHRWDSSIQVNLHFSPLKEIPSLWSFALTSTAHIGVYLTKLASQDYPAFTLQFGPTEKLIHRLANLPPPQDFSHFEQEIFRRFGPFGLGGLRGSVPMSEVLKIGTSEGKEETEVSAGIRRITSDNTLQEKIIGGLLALEKQKSSKATSK